METPTPQPPTATYTPSVRSGLSRASELRNRVHSQKLEVLRKAVKEGRLDEVKQFLSEGKIDPFSPESASSEEKPLLELAAECGHAEVVTALLNDERLHLQAGGRDYQAVHELLDRLMVREPDDADQPQIERHRMLETFLYHPRIDPNWQNENGPALLHELVSRDQFKETRLLLDRSNYHGTDSPLPHVDLNIRAGAPGFAPLHVAIMFGTSRIFKALLNAGADVNLRTNMSASGNTPLHYAVMFSRLEMLEQLAAKGADLNILNGEDLTPLQAAIRDANIPCFEALLKAGADLKHRDQNGDTLLIYALKTLQNAPPSIFKPIMDGLLENNADIINTVGASGRTPLFAAAQHCMFNIVKDFIELFGADPHKVDDNGDNALHAAAVSGYTNNVLQLLAANVDVNKAAENGRTPLFSGAQEGNGLVVQCLLDAGADPHLSDNEGNTALHAAAESGNLDAIAPLLAAGISPDTSADNGKTALFVAASRGNSLAAKKLLEAGADPHRTDNEGNTALHAAARANPDTIRLLLEAGAIPDQTNQDGETPLICAIKSRNYPAISMLFTKTKAHLDQANDLAKETGADDLKDLINKHDLNPEIEQHAEEEQKSRQLAKLIYEEGRYYQGTTEAYGADSRKDGMDPKNKTGSVVINNAFKEGHFNEASEEWKAEFKNRALSHYYFTTRKKITNPYETSSAKTYAKLAVGKESDRPKILRAFLPTGTIPLELDPDTTGGKAFYRTNRFIPSGYILNSKRNTPEVTEASEAFRNALNYHKERLTLQVDRIINSEQAAEMLHEQQTDSESDFSETEN